MIRYASLIFLWKGLAHLFVFLSHFHFVPIELLIQFRSIRMSTHRLPWSVCGTLEILSIMFTTKQPQINLRRTGSSPLRNWWLVLLLVWLCGPLDSEKLQIWQEQISRSVCPLVCLPVWRIAELSLLLPWARLVSHKSSRLANLFLPQW